MVIVFVEYLYQYDLNFNYFVSTQNAYFDGSYGYIFLV